MKLSRLQASMNKSSPSKFSPNKYDQDDKSSDSSSEDDEQHMESSKNSLSAIQYQMSDESAS